MYCKGNWKITTPQNNFSESYLSKSRFRLALECATKLFYTGKKEYTNQKLENDFLNELAKGGFKVGEYAKYFFTDDPAAITLHTKPYEYEESLRITMSGFMTRQKPY